MRFDSLRSLLVALTASRLCVMKTTSLVLVRSTLRLAPIKSFAVPTTRICPPWAANASLRTLSRSYCADSCETTLKCSVNDHHVLSSTSYGGDFAGHSANFCSKSGSLIPVPDHLLPSSLIEWGSIPSCLEVITSEDFSIQNESKEDRSSIETTAVIISKKITTAHLLERQIVSIVPEVGCGVDNLDTIHSSESYSFLKHSEENDNNIRDVPTSSSTCTIFDSGNIVALSRPSLKSKQNNHFSDAKANILHLETTFALPSHTEKTKSTQSSSTSTKEKNTSIIDTTTNVFPRRVRVSFDINIQERTIVSPINIVMERQTSKISTRGAIDRGGGLDGRTVASLIGIDLFNRPFSDSAGIPLTKILSTEDQLTPCILDRKNTCHDEILSLPGNIVLCYSQSPFLCNDSWMIHVSIIQTCGSTENGRDSFDGFSNLLVKWNIRTDDVTKIKVECWEESYSDGSGFQCREVP